MFKLKSILWFFVVVEIGIVAALWGYVSINTSHHTAWNPYALFTVFVPLLVIGLISAIVFKRKRSQLIPSMLLGLVSLAGIILILVLDKTNRLLQYEEWVRRGMP